jgi:hypothetical protein
MTLVPNFYPTFLPNNGKIMKLVPNFNPTFLAQGRYVAQQCCPPECRPAECRFYNIDPMMPGQMSPG